MTHPIDRKFKSKFKTKRIAQIFREKDGIKGSPSRLQLEEYADKYDDCRAIQVDPVTKKKHKGRRCQTPLCPTVKPESPRGISVCSTTSSRNSSTPVAFTRSGWISIAGMFEARGSLETCSRQSARLCRSSPADPCGNPSSSRPEPSSTSPGRNLPPT